MNRRPIPFIVTAAVALVLLLAWWLIPGEGPKPATESARTESTVQRIVRTTPAAPTPGRDEDRLLKQAERAKAINAIIESGNVPINFWGKVVDQEGNPVSGVAIRYSYSTEHGNLLGVAWSASKVHKGSTASNETGVFSIQRLRGSVLSIESLQKEGYSYNPRRANTYDYYGSNAAGKFKPESNNPVLFVMTNKATAEPLVSFGGDFGKTMRLPGDGAPVRWSVWKGQIDPNGELQVTFTREPAVLARVGQPATWSAKVEIVGGGIIEASPDELLYRAPEEGYVSVLDYPKSEQKRGVGHRDFYIKTADEKFGRIQLELYPGDDGPTARCLIKSSLNPNGSRNLEK